MPVMIGVVSGLLDGLGISLLSKGNIILGAGWFFVGLAVAWALYMRVRDEEKAAVRVASNRPEQKAAIEVEAERRDRKL